MSLSTLCISSSKGREFVRAIVAQPGVTGVADNREQPGAAIPAIEAAEKLKRAQAGLLNHVFRVLVIAGQPAGQVVGRIEMG